MKNEDYTTKAHEEENASRHLLLNQGDKDNKTMYRNSRIEAIPEVDTPTKSLNGSGSPNHHDKDKKSGPQIVHDGNTYDPIGFRYPQDQLQQGMRPTEYDRQSSCDAKSPIVVIGGDDVDIPSNEKQASLVVTDCGNIPDFNKVTEVARSEVSDIPIIINTPPSPAVLPDYNPPVIELSHSNNDLQSPGETTPNASSVTDGTSNDASKKTILTMTSDSCVISSSLNDNGHEEVLIVSDKDSIAVIVPTSNHSENRDPSNQYVDDDPGQSIDAQGITESAIKEASSTLQDNTKNSSADLHLQNTPTCTPEVKLNLASPLAPNSRVECNGSISSADDQCGHRTETNSNCNTDNTCDTGETHNSIDTSATIESDKSCDPISNARDKDSQPKRDPEQSPPLHLRPFWRVQEPSTGKFTVARIYSSDDHINSIKSRLMSDGNSNKHDRSDRVDGSSNGHLHQGQKAAPRQLLSPLAAMDLGTSQTVSLYGINGYSGQHPHHDQHHVRKRHAHHHHSFYELGGSRVEIVEGLNKGMSSSIKR